MDCATCEKKAAFDKPPEHREKVNGMFLCRESFGAGWGEAGEAGEATRRDAPRRATGRPEALSTHRVRSHRIASHRIVSHRIASHRMVERGDQSRGARPSLRSSSPTAAARTKRTPPRSARL